jgi:hypothetical protein
MDGGAALVESLEHLFSEKNEVGSSNKLEKNFGEKKSVFLKNFFEPVFEKKILKLLKSFFPKFSLSSVSDFKCLSR